MKKDSKKTDLSYESDGSMGRETQSKRKAEDKQPDFFNATHNSE